MSLIPAEQAADQTFNKTSINSQSGSAIYNFVKKMFTTDGDDIDYYGDLNSCPSGFSRRGASGSLQAHNVPKNGYWFNVLTIRENLGDGYNYAFQIAMQTTNIDPKIYVRTCNGVISGTSNPNWSAWKEVTTKTV